jgi:hypothetical protein
MIEKKSTVFVIFVSGGEEARKDGDERIDLKTGLVSAPSSLSSPVFRRGCLFP